MPKKNPRPSLRPRSRRRYNWIPDLPDQRDLLFRKVMAPPAKLPRAVDLRAHCPPVVNQGQIGSCTGNSLAGLIGYLELRELKSGGPEVFTKGKFSPISRLFIYYNERALEGTVDSDHGAQLRDGVKSLLNDGFCRESTWKYGESQVLKKPSAQAYTEATKHKISQYVRLSTLDEMRHCLASNFPFVFGFTVYESFETAEVKKTGIMPMPEAAERVLGGHAVMAVGYDDAKRHLIIRNSWGTSWGQDGHFLMPYAYIQERGLADDFWTIRK
jgi:C1A family cysteine protease